jgi:hypothetical protein
MKSVRIASHIHSEWSYDAEWSLHDIARAFRRRRYDVVLMSEHDREFTEQRWKDYQQACQEASTDGILLVPGIEYEDADNVVHTPVWGTDVPFLGSGRSTLELLRSANSEGAVAVLAHPWRRNAVSRYHPDWAPLLSAVEIWNRKYDGFAPHLQCYEFTNQYGLRPFVSLDFHTGRQFFPLAMTVQIEAAISPHAIIDAIRRGNCRPEFLGLSALRFTGGKEGATLRALEAVRRGIRKPFHRTFTGRSRTVGSTSRQVVPPRTQQERSQRGALTRIASTKETVQDHRCPEE